SKKEKNNLLRTRHQQVQDEPFPSRKFKRELVENDHTFSLFNNQPRSVFLQTRCGSGDERSCGTSCAKQTPVWPTSRPSRRDDLRQTRLRNIPGTETA